MLAVSTTEEIYVLDQGARTLAHVDVLGADGTRIGTSQLGALIPEGLRVDGQTLIVRDGLTNFWATAFVGRTKPVSGPNQMESAQGGRALSSLERQQAAAFMEDLPSGPSSPRLVMSVTDEWARIAIVSGQVVQAVWEITSERNIGEMQLAEVTDRGLLVVIRTWDEASDAFEVLTLDRSGLVNSFAVGSEAFADSAPLGRFELGPSGLYQMRSTDSEFSIVRFDY